MNSKAKGDRGEREWALFLRDEGFSSARRGQQFSGDPDAPDVRCDDLPWIHWEVKRVQRLVIKTAMAQALGDCGTKMAIVTHRVNNAPWLATLRATDLMVLIREYIGSEKTQTSTEPCKDPDR